MTLYRVGRNSPIVKALLEAIDMVINEPERRQRLWENQRYFIEAMGAAGLSVTCTDTPILPFHVGDETDCLRIAGGLEAAGYHVDAITFPAIPLGQSRLRFMMNAGHTRAQIDGAVGALAHLSRELHVAPIA